MSKKIKIMIADDFNLLVEDMTEVINQQTDMEVIATASSAEEIVEISAQQDYDIILMDIEMETMQAGIEATRKIRERDPTAKIIFLTAHGTNDVILNAMATGAIDYIVKGLSEKEILQHIRSAFEGKSLMDAKIQQVIMQEYSRLRQTEESLVLFINNLSLLTQAERDIIALLLQDKKIREIAELRFVEVVTVKTQISGILRKMGERRTRTIVKKIRELNLTHLFNKEDD